MKRSARAVAAAVVAGFVPLALVPRALAEETRAITGADTLVVWGDPVRHGTPRPATAAPTAYPGPGLEPAAPGPAAPSPAAAPTTARTEAPVPARKEAPAGRIPDWLKWLLPLIIILGIAEAADDD